MHSVRALSAIQRCGVNLINGDQMANRTDLFPLTDQEIGQ